MSALNIKDLLLCYMFSNCILPISILPTLFFVCSDKLIGIFPLGKSWVIEQCCLLFFIKNQPGRWAAGTCR